MGLGDLLDFGQDQGSFVFERVFHQLVITFGIFTGAMFELEIAKIIVNHVATFKELVEFGAMRSEVGGVGVNVENEEEHGGDQGEAGTEGGPVGDGGQWRVERGEWRVQS